MFGLRRASVRAPSPRNGVVRASERVRRPDIAGLESAWVGKRRHSERAGARLTLPPPGTVPERTLALLTIRRGVCRYRRATKTPTKKPTTVPIPIACHGAS
jgi:hypothetical protein